jgi:high-affinity iron transporter
MALNRLSFLIILFIAASLVFFTPSAKAAQTAPAQADAGQTAWQLLDYIAVDYSGAVENGEVISDIEYAEMTEFATVIRTNLAALPPSAAQSKLMVEAEALEQAIGQKAAPEKVSAIAKTLANDLLLAYPVPLAPSSAPDIAIARTLYAEGCASCHGVFGQADGPLAQNMVPAPIDFTDRDRARKRSPFALYQAIDRGIDGTSMPGFANLDSNEKWALAFYVSGLAYSQEEARKGEKLWRSNEEYRAAIPDFKSFTQINETELAKRFDGDIAAALTAYLRQSPEALAPSASGLLATAHERIRQTLEAYQDGDFNRARQLALSAYLDGFEPIEPVLSIKDPALLRQIEQAMVEIRRLISDKAPAEQVAKQAQQIHDLLGQAENVLTSSATGASASFLAAFTILLREGLEALLIIVAMLAFLNKAKRTEEVRYVHAGWIGAIIAGLLTWVAASSIISISGASREMTEGFGALTAAIVLLFVGIWMHGKSNAGAWQKYIKEKMSHALSRQSSWFLFFLAFLVVYREAFETILFFIALWSQGNEAAIIAGAIVAILVLGVAAWALMNYSKRLPITQFFLYSSIVMAGLAVILAGKGVAALQEAGMIPINATPMLPRIELLGLYPTWEGLVSQLIVLGILLAAFWINDRQSRQTPGAP